VSETPSPANPRWRAAARLTDAVRRRFSADVLAVAVHGDLAHGDDTDASDVNLVVITYDGHDGLHPATRRVDGTIVDLGVIAAEQYLTHARTLTTAWPLAADQYLNTRATFDPDGWCERLRDTHLARLAEATGEEFAALARQAWYLAASAHARALRLVSWYEVDAGMIALSEARVGAALVEGLLSRTYFRDGADAVRRTGLAGLDLTELGERLGGQAEELARWGRPVDGTIEQLFE
jgi:hypothetical protein